MQQARRTLFKTRGNKKVVSRVDAMALMIAAAVAAIASTALTVTGIIETFTGPVTLTLPVASTQQQLAGLQLGAEGRFTAVEVTLPAVPSDEAVLLVWAGVLSQVGILAVLVLLFLLAFRLRGENLFTPGSVWIVGACGAVLAIAGTAGQVIDSVARNRLAELVGANQRTPDESIIFMADFNIGPVMAGIVLVLVAGVFQFGLRLQKDAEGLV
ncbi:MAG: hypothetical protein ACLGHS_07000 [Actinomycetes bacterium]